MNFRKQGPCTMYLVMKSSPRDSKLLADSERLSLLSYHHLTPWSEFLFATTKGIGVVQSVIVSLPFYANV